MILTDIFVVQPCDLNSNIEFFLRDKIEEKWLNQCIKQYGYIVDIKRIKSFSNDISMSFPHVLFTVKFDAVIVDPKIGDLLTGKITIIDIENHGMVVKNDLFLTFIPTKDINCVNLLREGDEVEFEITFKRYKNNKFNYIGRYIRKVS